jgi:phage/conjugal plasmid C-4 type zinc finger TraR family protein
MSTDLNDEESFFINQEAINEQLNAVHEAINQKSHTTVCLECGEDIGEKRLEAYPAATLCIDCASILEKKPQDGKSRIFTRCSKEL